MSVLDDHLLDYMDAMDIAMYSFLGSDIQIQSIRRKHFVEGRVPPGPVDTSAALSRHGLELSSAKILQGAPCDTYSTTAILQQVEDAIQGKHSFISSGRR